MIIKKIISFVILIFILQFFTNSLHASSAIPCEESVSSSSSVLSLNKKTLTQLEANIWQGEMLCVKEHKCSTCEKDKILRRCSACLQASYCCYTEQRKDWPSHKLLCSSKNLLTKKKLKFFQANREALRYALNEILPRDLSSIINIDDIRNLHRIFTEPTFEYLDIKKNPGTFRDRLVIWPKKNLQYGQVVNRDVFLKNDEILNLQIRLGLESSRRDEFITKYMRLAHWEKNSNNAPSSIDKVSYAFIPYIEENTILALDQDYIFSMGEDEFKSTLSFARRNIEFFHPESSDFILKELKEGRNHISSFDYSSYIEISLNTILSELQLALSCKPEFAVEHAAFFHAKIVKLHPFFDANKRLARFLMNLILLKSGHNILLLDRPEIGEAYNQICIDSLDNLNLFSTFIKGIIK